MASFVCRRSRDGAVLDPSKALTDLVRAALHLDQGCQIAIMQMQCGSCGDPDCSEIESIIQIDAGAAPRRLRIAKAMRRITRADVLMAQAASRP
ncbi:hypothetical protein [Bosea vaviloviae]|uniref:Uncharacterized protein n=1 Tax=Bosea vaviloviae TaxID=1526658 RepID=A0A1D7UCG6_9HYPH|nr:hypothetical protein [Bosea vaviloviae]AOO85057.1 hypothetical protein BHK69_30585 [Bosea vaviloviae]